MDKQTDGRLTTIVSDEPKRNKFGKIKFIKSWITTRNAFD